MAAGERLYALTSALSLEPINFPHGEGPYPWEPDMQWTWNALPEMALYYNGTEVSAYALHPDGRTIFVSSPYSTCSWDTSTGASKDLGYWALPFSGQAYYDADLDAWVGLHHSRYGHVCCCPVVSRSSARQEPPGCQMLLEKLARRKEDPTTHSPLLRPGEKSSLTYMRDSRYALFENILRGKDHDDGAVLHVTLFGLKYDHNGELRTKVLRSTRSYVVSKNTNKFSHTAFWL
ncbi:hypothetical protein BS78_02G394500 [Paspalum vaginatum]|nr:hypothetical protein BS78_02G394500 [Paspalum vaginatum]